MILFFKDLFFIAPLPIPAASAREEAQGLFPTVFTR
jgi:hypothetical protein